VIVFDITQYDTYVSTKEWLKEAQGNIDDDAFIFLIGNRADLEE
jgi:GTPase SAR1 family protein